MIDNEEWSEWKIHDGKGCPCRGEFVHIVDAKGAENVGIAGSLFAQYPWLPDGSWNWDNVPFVTPVTRYRIRKPRGLTILEELIADLPAPVGPKIDA